MLIPGLVSVTFRQKTRAEIAQLMQKAALPAIEWGGDVHIPADKYDSDEFEDALTEAAYLCSSGKIYTASFGSYYRCDRHDEVNSAITLSLDAPNIRVWAGNKNSEDASDNDRRNTVSFIRELCEELAPHGVTVSTEFHGGTLTNEYHSALRLIEEVGCENFRTYWQPNQFRDEEYNVAALKSVLPYLSSVHVFTWDAHARYPLADGEKKWRNYIDIIESFGGDHHMLMEFVKDDSEEQFLRDAEVLNRWLGR